MLVSHYLCRTMLIENCFVEALVGLVGVLGGLEWGEVWWDRFVW